MRNGIISVVNKLSIRWKKLRPDNNHMTLYAPCGNWKNGTFIGIHDHKDHCYELFVSTISDDPAILTEALVHTKRIQWNNNLVIKPVHEDYQQAVMKALKQTTFRLHKEHPCYIYCISAETASRIEINCPSEVYINKLKTSHAEFINSHWPHRYENSEKYIANLIEMNGGHGVFLKRDRTLVAWILRNIFGLGMLHTIDEYKRKGYGSLISKVLIKELGKQGLNPTGTVYQNNDASKEMAKKQRYEGLERPVITESIEYIESSSNGDTRIEKSTDYPNQRFLKSRM